MLRCRFPAIPSELQRVRRWAERAAADFGFDPTDRYEFMFAVNEAVTNAIRHGKPARDGTIGVELDADGDTLICSVVDHGDFFAPPPESGPLAERGRGFEYMALVMDRVELATAAGGTTVRLHKRRRCQGPEHGG